jgi:hypothetical protein
MTISPRRRYFASIVTGFCVLAVFGFSLHYAATVLRWRVISARLAAFESRVDALEEYERTADARFSSLRQIGAASNISSVSTSSDPPRLRPRLLGSGRSGAWRYSDLRMPSGSVRRYYCRTNSTPADLVRLAATIRADLADDVAIDANQ